MEMRGGLGPGGRHPRVLRHSGPRPSHASFLDQRVRDGVLLALIGKWLKAGVLEDGSVTHPDAGTPQGGVISPLLANVYLHEVLDEWFEQDGQAAPRGAGVPDPLRGRLRHGLRAGGRCATGAGRAAEAIRQVRPDPPPGEDPAGPISRPPRASGPDATARPAGSTCWASPTTGAGPGRGTGWCKRKTAPSRFSRALEARSRVVPAQPPPADRDAARAL